MSEDVLRSLHSASDLLFHKRCEARAETNWIAMIRMRDGTEVACNVKDVSRSGAKLGVPSSVTLPDTFMLKVLGRSFVCLVKLAWRRGNYAGVRIERVGKLSEAEEKPIVETDSVPVEVQSRSENRPRGSKISAF